VFRWLTERRRRHLLETPFPDAWRAYLEVNVGAYALLDDAERARLRDLAHVFIAEKHWEGAGGLEVDDEVRVTIAGTGCLMLLGRDHDLFDDIGSIVVYPSSVVVPPAQQFLLERAGRVIAPTQPLVGQAFGRGPVILAWDAVKKGARDPRDGRNVVIHEFAHKIDFLDGDADGAPPLPDRASYRAWATAMQTAYDAHRARAEHHQPSLLRDYAIASPAEYFAVASEMFFERPRDLATELPDVYAQLRDFYRLDLAAR
jgi:Mlc titration factor MtfA (ptsG expression regulator)